MPPNVILNELKRRQAVFEQDIITELRYTLFKSFEGNITGNLYFSSLSSEHVEAKGSNLEVGTNLDTS